MYHRFHAPHDLRVSGVTYFSGDAWNVNPPALKRVEKLFCKNERALIRTRLEASGHEVLLVPVAAVLVASIRLHFADVLLHLKLPRAEPHRLRRAPEEGRGDGLVPARLHHPGIRAARLQPVRRAGQRDPRRSAPNAPTLIRGQGHNSF